MPAPQQSPIRRRGRLGSELRQLREAAGLTGDQVIERIGWNSASKLSRLENGRSKPEVQDVVALLDLYGADPAKRDEVVMIARDAGDLKGWLRSYASKMTDAQMPYAELEAGCAEIWEFSPIVVPGLLQTADYTRIRLESTQPLNQAHPPKRELAALEAEVSARTSRQMLLTREEEPALYHAVLDEAVFGVRAGPPNVLQSQIRRLRTLAELPNVTIQLLLRDTPVNGGWYLPHTGFSLYRFPDPNDPEAGSIEGLDSNLAIDDEKEIKRYKMVFGWLQAAALSAEDTIRWLAEAALTRTNGSHDSHPGVPKPPSQRGPRTGRLTEP
ncbi:helix-turn-helix domain-containing protein [Micromonospora zhanjiangensis]|uniref:Helix-turn-helix domain-containing protein n=1 Tax=Micromonospora zhanjiangensis TaxID=1522057 RepID=A0ABV8KLD3_9ACTN